MTRTEEFVQDLIRQVHAEARLARHLTAEIKSLAAEQERERIQAALRLIVLALVIDLMIGGVLLGFGQL